MFEAQFQTFDDPEGGVALSARLAAFREDMLRQNLTGFVIPHADSQQNEYVPPSEERLAWLTGFTGSAGLAVVLTRQAALFVDGRYTLQAAQQVDTTAWSVEISDRSAPRKLAGKNIWYQGTASDLTPGCTRLRQPSVSPGPAKRPGRSLSRSNAIRWTRSGPNGPAPPLGPVAVHSQQFAGESEASKLTRIRAEIAKLNLDALVLSDSHAVAWTFNIRGADVAHTPLPLSYALLPREGRPTVFIDDRKLSDAARDHIAISAIIMEPEALLPALTILAENSSSIGLDAATAADELSRVISAAGGKPRRGPDPVALLKAIKNPTEIEGARTAHRRDGAALARFLAWIDREAPSGALTEIDAVEALETFRRDTRRAEGRVVSHHRRHRAERRHRALPRHPQDQPPHRAGRPATDGFRRAI